MKKLFLFLAMAIISANAFSQSIQNSSFENWSPVVYFQDPDLYFTSNLQSYLSADTSAVLRTADHYQGNYGCKLQTFTGSNNDTINGIAIMGMPSGGGLSGGIPFTVKADTIYGFFKYNVQLLDTAVYAVVFKNNGSMLGYGSIQFTGVQTSYTLKKSKVSWLLPFSPDTCIIILASSNLNGGERPGSILIADSLFVKAGAVKTSLPNGNFETWNTTGFDEPNNWTTSNFAFVGNTSPSVTKSNDAQSGLYACRIESLQSTFGDTLGVVTNGTFGNNGPDGGMQVWLNPDVVSGYYKYSPVGPDSAVVLVMTHRYETTLGIRIKIDSALLKLPAASVYTPFQLQLPYSNWPYVDSISISFASGNIVDSNTYFGLGSVLLIDNLNITYKPAAIDENALLKARAWPNPAKDFFHLTLSEKSENLIFSLIDITGKIVSTEILPNDKNDFTISLKDMKPGMYFYSLQSDGNPVYGKIIVR